jgi:hypothetical protein
MDGGGDMISWLDDLIGGSACPLFGECPFDLVGAVAERLTLALTAGAPPIILAFFHYRCIGGIGYSYW